MKKRMNDRATPSIRNDELRKLAVLESPNVDKKLLMDEANAIYAELEPESVFGKKKIRMRSAGIMPAYRDLDGSPLPRYPL